MFSALRNAGRYLAVTREAIGHHLFAILALGLVGAAIEGFGILLFIPILMRLVSDNPETPPGMVAGSIAGWAEGHTIGGLLGLLVLIFAAKGLLIFGIQLYRARVFNQARERMRLELFDALGRARPGGVEARRMGALGNLLVHEIDHAAYAMRRYCAALGAAVTAALLFGIAVALAPLLSLALAVSGAMTLGLVRIFTGMSMSLSRDSTSRAGNIASLAVESLQAFKYLHATGRFGILRRAFGDAVEGARRVDDRAAAVDAVRFSIREPLLVLWISAVFYLFVVVLRTNLGVITDGILFFYRVSVELGFFQDHWHEFAHRVGAIDAYRNLRRELDAETEPDLGTLPLRFEKSIALDSVRFGYGGTEVLRGVDLEIPKLETVALVGASGVGKSTLVDIAAGCLEPTSGWVRVDGADLADVRRSEYRRALGYVTQESVMFSGSIARNVSMRWDDELDEDTLSRAREAARLAGCLDFIEGLERSWNTEIGERGHRLSGGERQRIAIARELYAEPALLIFDEATSALDSISEQAVQTSIESLHGKTTLLIVAHRLSTIRRADVIHVLDDGRIVEHGTFDELSQRPDGHFRRLCEIQSLV